MIGITAGIKEVYDLIKLMQKQKTTHAFVTSEYEDGRDCRILTFSPTPPPKELYKSGKSMLIENRGY